MQAESDEYKETLAHKSEVRDQFEADLVEIA